MRMAPFVSQKLDFLMKLVDVPNNALGKAVSFDASYISRIRAGLRNLPTHTSFIEPASTFLARHITEAYQKDVMAKITSCGAQWPEDMGQAAAPPAAEQGNHPAPPMKKSFPKARRSRAICRAISTRKTPCASSMETMASARR